MADKIRLKSFRDIYPYVMSEDYKNRFIGEYLALLYRIRKLDYMLIKAKNDLLDFPLTCPISLLETQLETMKDYKRVLEVRAEIEKITFPEVRYE